jgi:hypothetical protein
MREKLETVAVRRSAAERARAAARARGVKFCDYATSCMEAGPITPLDPLGEFLRAVLDIVWTDHFHIGEDGLWTTEAEYGALPEPMKRMVQEVVPLTDRRLRVTVVSKEWAMKMAVEQFRADEHLLGNVSDPRAYMAIEGAPSPRKS